MNYKYWACELIAAVLLLLGIWVMNPQGNWAEIVIGALIIYFSFDLVTTTRKKFKHEHKRHRNKMIYTLEHGDVWLGNDVIGLSEIVQTLNAKQSRINELERVMQKTHIHSRKHTPGYCTVRQSDIDAIGNALDPHVHDEKD